MDCKLLYRDGEDALVDWHEEYSHIRSIFVSKCSDLKLSSCHLLQISQASEVTSRIETSTYIAQSRNPTGYCTYRPCVSHIHEGHKIRLSDLYPVKCSATKW
jgi:hypothetical protein